MWNSTRKKNVGGLRRLLLDSNLYELVKAIRLVKCPCSGLGLKSNFFS